MRLFFRVTVGGVILIGVLLVGCRREHGLQHVATADADSADAGRVDADRRSADVAKGKVASSAVLTDRQEAALQGIEAAGGVVELDAAGLPLLIDLASGRVSADDEVIRELAEFPELLQLRLAVANAAPESFGALESLHQLTTLYLQDASLADQNLTTILAAMPALRRLTLVRLSGISTAILPALRQCEHVEALALIEMDGVSAVMLAGLNGMPSLRMLDVRGCGSLASGDFGELLRLSELVDLKLGGPAVDDGVLSMITRHPRIFRLAIDNAEVSSGCFECLAADSGFAGRLRSLTFTGCFGVSDETLLALPRFQHLESLTLRNIFVTGSFMTQLRGTATGSPVAMPPLKTLIVTNGFLTDQAIEHLPELFPRLRRLDLRGNAGITDESLDVFRRWADLKELCLKETGVTDPSSVRAKQ